MRVVNQNTVIEYVREHIGAFHQQRIDCLSKLKLRDVLKRKNPYLFRVKSLNLAHEVVKGITDAHISSNEETIFGNWLEGLVIFVNEKAYGGKKSGINGIDLEFDKDLIRYIVSIKSGPNWGNSSQIRKMVTSFNTAKKTLRTSQSRVNVIAVNGCCYGKDKNPDKGEYFKYCGQEFWEFISGDSELYCNIIEPLGNNAKKRNEEFQKLYDQRFNCFVAEFVKVFCKSNGEIDWEKFVKYNSEKENVRLNQS
ncbi:MAG: hypothetical protein LBU34_02955 [Planctomycetaceae bacterium]|jgi:hypothetical protein|nr:hypothetical protein [Planctomycetaceae bacterium]